MSQTFFKQSAIGRFAFLVPPLGGLGATYDVHLRLTGKRVVDFLLVFVELFFSRCYGRGAAIECRLKIAVFAPTGSKIYPKFQVEGVAPSPTNHFSCHKARVNYLSCGFLWELLFKSVYDIDIKNVCTTFFRFVTNHAFDRRTYGQTAFSSLDRVMQCMQRGKKWKLRGTRCTVFHLKFLALGAGSSRCRYVCWYVVAAYRDRTLLIPSTALSSVSRSGWLVHYIKQVRSRRLRLSWGKLR